MIEAGIFDGDWVGIPLRQNSCRLKF
jgi:SOS-response transcriptional repressor LexA